MGSNEVWATCQDCGAELKQGDKQCPKCGSTKKVHEVTVSDGLVLRDGLGVKHKRRGFKRPLAETKSGWKPSGDPKLEKGVHEDVVVDREKGEYHQVVKDATTGKVIHEEHQRLSEHGKRVNNGKPILRKLGKLWLGAICTIVIAVSGYVVWFYLLPILQRPMEPSVISFPGPNPAVNTASIQSIILTAIPDFKPPYSNYVGLKITNPNPYKCYMVLEFRTTEGFKFLPITESLLNNFRVEQGYEYTDVMKVYIKDFPPEFAYDVKLPVYTLNYDAFHGAENVSISVLEVRRED